MKALVALALLSAVGLATGAGAGKSEESAKQPTLKHVYRAGLTPSGYLERTARLWGFEAEGQGPVGEILFSATAGNLPGQEPERYNVWPTVLVRFQEGWRMVDFKEGFHHYKWSQAAVAPDKGYLWGALEYTIEGSGSEIPILLSTDGGRTWTHVTSINKPDHEAVLDRFEMSTTGRGRLVMTSGVAPAPGTQTIFTYTTKDWGRTWQKPPMMEISALANPSASPGREPCWLAVQHLPEPLPEVCRLPDSIQP